MKNLGGIICGLCLNYYVEPVTAKCTHSFCEYCLQQYFLHFHKCPICELDIRKQKAYPARSLCQFTQNFVSEEDADSLDDYYLRKKQAREWKQSRKISQVYAGMRIDIRDDQYTWHLGTIIRVISRIGESHKYLKVGYLKQIKSEQEIQIQEQVKVTSQRLSLPRTYTKRSM